MAQCYLRLHDPVGRADEAAPEGNASSGSLTSSLEAGSTGTEGQPSATWAVPECRPNRTEPGNASGQAGQIWVMPPSTVLETIDAFRITELPSFKSGSAYCTVNRRPLTLALNVLSKCSSVIAPSGANSPMPALAKRMSMWPFCCFTAVYKRSRSVRFDLDRYETEQIFRAEGASPLLRYR